MDISKIYSKAWQITKQFKWLWVVGMMVAAFSTSNSSFNFSQNFNSGGSEFNNSFSGNTFESTGEQLTNTFGNYITGYFAIIKELFSGIPLWLWGGIIALVGSLIILGFVIRIFVLSWAQGALIGGTANAAAQIDGTKSESIKLHEISAYGKKSYKSFLWLNIIPGLVLLVYLLLMALILILFFSLKLQIIAIPLGILLLIGFMLLNAFFALVKVWAMRIAVIERLPGKESFIEGFNFTKKYFWQTIVLGIVNQVLGCFLGLGTLLIVGVLIVFIMLGFAISPAIGALFAFPLAVFIAASMFLGILGKGIYAVFNYSTWTIAYLDFKAEEAAKLIKQNEQERL